MQGSDLDNDTNLNNNTRSNTVSVQSIDSQTCTGQIDRAIHEVNDAKHYLHHHKYHKASGELIDAIQHIGNTFRCINELRPLIIVDAGPDQDIVLPDVATLSGTVTVDGVPVTDLAVIWEKVSGPGNVVISNPGQLITTASFSETGEYALRLTAYDSTGSSSDELTIRVDAIHRTYTTDADFNEGTKENLSSIVPDQLQLDDSGTPVPEQGTWTVVFDSDHSGLEWGVIGWNGAIYNDSLISVAVASSEDGINFSVLQTVTNQSNLSVLAGRYLKIVVTLKRSTDGKSPILTDITLGAKGYKLPHVVNHAPLVDAGSDAITTIAQQLELRGEVSDDCLPDGLPLNIAWSKVSGPGEVVFGNPELPVTTASFGETGEYLLRLSAADSELSTSDDVVVRVDAVYRTYTTDADFNEGTKVNISSIVPDQIQLDDMVQLQNFIWVAVSSKGTIVKINTDTCEIMGEYWTSPEGQPKDPSRTTVDLNGNVWATNRAGNSVVCIGLVENNQWIDKNGNIKCDTSTTQGDIKPWTNAGNADTDGGVSTAEDECILHYTRVSSPGTRHVSVTKDNNIWVSGTGNRKFDLIDGKTGQIIRTEESVGYGGYGGLIDPSGVIWSARPLLRWDTSKPLTGPNGVNWKGYSHDSYGLGIDSKGNVWNTSAVGNRIYKFAPDGTLIGVYAHGSNDAQGCVVDKNDDVWVAHSLNGANNTVGHLKNDGTWVGNVVLGDGPPAGPTGVAVDSNGKIWVTNYNTRNVMRIDPNAGPIGADGVTHVGEVDYTSPDLGGNLYNYSDMTGSTLIGAPEQGTWTVVFDSGRSGIEWGVIGWNGTIYNDGLINVSVASSEDSNNFSALQNVSNQGELSVPDGRYLKIIVSLKRSSDGKSPILTDITMGTKGYELPPAVNHAPLVEAGPDAEIIIGQQLELYGEVSDDCLPDGMPLNISWSKESGPSEVTFVETAGPVWVKASFEQVGEYQLSLTASDSSSSSSDALYVVVKPINLAPVVDAGPDQDIVLPDFALLNGTVTDDGLPPGVELIILWSKVSGPGEVVFGNPDRPVTTASFSETGEYVLRLSASDSELSSSDDVIVRVDSVHRTYTTDADFNEGTKVNLSSIITDQLQLDDSETPLPEQGTWTVVFDSAHSGLEWGVIGWSGNIYNDSVMTVAVASSEDGISFSALQNVTNYSSLSIPAGRYLKIVVSLERSSDGKSPILTDITVGAKGYKLPPVVNHAPLVDAGPDTEITLDQQLELRGEVSDDCLPDGSPLNIAWSKESGPGEVTFDTSTGPVWVKASFGETGEYGLRLTANDSISVNSDSMQVTVNPAPEPDYERPVVQLTIDPAQVNVGETVNITVNASDNVGVVSRTLKINGVLVELDELGKTTYISSGPGLFKAQASALDAAGNEGYASEEFMVITSGDIVPPVVSFSLPEEAAKLYLPTTIQGTASDENLISYKLEYSEKDKNEFIEFASGNSSVVDGALGIFDPTLLINGLFDVRLTAIDASGNMSSVIRTFEVEGQAKIGNFSISFNDLTIPVSGMPISIIRTFDSRNLLKGDFGIGWTISMQNVRLSESCVPGQNWEQSVTGSTYHLSETKQHLITVTYPDGKTDRFQMVLTPDDQWLQPIFETTVSYSPLAGTFSTLEALADNYCIVSSNVGPVELLDYSSLNTYNPNRYKLTQKDGTVLIINQATGLESITDKNGNTVTFGSGGITHSSGKSVVFERDSEGRIITVNDLLGNQIRYSYDYYGDLVAVTNQVGEITRFMYNSRHQIIDIISPTGIVPSRNLYDDDGRLIAQIDSAGNRIEYTHNIGASQEIVTDRLGNQTVIAYDERGNVLSNTDSLGNTTTYTYDVQDNVLSKTDALGITTLYTYDEYNNKTSETNALGFKIEFTYDSRRNILTTKDPMGNVTINTYDSNGNLISTTDTLGNETSYDYDLSGNLKTTTNPLGYTENYTNDQYGNMTSSTDYSGYVTTYTYDANGNQLTQTTSRTDTSGTESMTIQQIYDGLNRIVETIYPNGKSTRTEFNSIGKKAAVVDPLGNRTEYLYDNFGNLIETLYADGTKEILTYDLEGSILSSTDPEGRTTYLTYDKNKRLIKTTYPDDTNAQLEYDAVGNRVKTINERGAATVYAYDSAKRNISITDAAGNVTLYQYDANNNQVKTTDANGHNTRFLFNANNQTTKIIFNDSTEFSTEYDTMGRKVQETDPAGNITKYQYNANGNLVKVIDALGNETWYSYDEVGNKVLQVDAQGNQTKYEYDNMGNLTKLWLPLGMSESFGYDPKGRVISHTDFNGNTTQYEYDLKDRKVKEISPDAKMETYSYTQNGQRKSVADLNGTTLYEYDLRDRLIQQTNPNGTVISYTYDAASNRTGMTMPSGTTYYAYDQLNRLTTVVDPNGVNTVYTYDAVGNRACEVSPNGVVTEYTYDTLNRLIRLVSKKSDGEVISSYEYLLGPSGNKLKVTELTGRMVDYSYDSTYKLVEEKITDTVAGNRTISYSYDKVGNRTVKVDNGITTNYAYDQNDRLVSEGTNTYTYDNNGNTLSRSGVGESVSYSYDYRNRLIGIDTNLAGETTSVNCIYNSDGIRIKKTVGSSLINYLIDENRDFAQVLEERDTSGNLLASYNYGEDLISQTRGAEVKYYNYDGHGNTRSLTNQSEISTDTYTYDAFGVTLDSTGTTVNEYLYCGEQYDNNLGFYYLRARYLNPAIGRFINADRHSGGVYDLLIKQGNRLDNRGFQPFGISGRILGAYTGFTRFGVRNYNAFTGRRLMQDPLRYGWAGTNLYIYASNNPINLIDPSGELTLVESIVVSGILGALGGGISAFVQGKNIAREALIGFGFGVLSGCMMAALGAALLSAPFLAAHPVLVGAISGAIVGVTTKWLRALAGLDAWPQNSLEWLKYALIGAIGGSVGGWFKEAGNEYEALAWSSVFSIALNQIVYILEALSVFIPKTEEYKLPKTFWEWYYAIPKEIDKIRSNWGL